MDFGRALTLAAASLLLFSATHGHGQEAATSADRQLRNQLYSQEQQLATAEKRQDKQYFQRALDPNLIYVAYNGLVFTKTKVLQSLHYIDISRYSIENMKVQALGSNAGLVTYDLLLSAKIAGHDLPAKQYASSVWFRRGSSWVLLFHQSTPSHHE